MDDRAFQPEFNKQAGGDQTSPGTQPNVPPRRQQGQSAYTFPPALYGAGAPPMHPPQGGYLGQPPYPPFGQPPNPREGYPLPRPGDSPQSANAQASHTMPSQPLYPPYGRPTTPYYQPTQTTPPQRYVAKPHKRGLSVWQWALIAIGVPIVACCVLGMVLGTVAAVEGPNSNSQPTLASATDTPTPSPTSTPTPLPTWKAVLTFKGDPLADITQAEGTYYTEAFQLKGQWKIHWTSGQDDVGALFAVSLANADGTPTHGEMVVENLDYTKVEGDSKVFTNTGSFRFRLMAYQSWTITLYEYI